MSNEIVKKEPEVVQHEPGGELFVFARDPSEMTQAQQAQIEWAKRKMLERQAEQNELQESFDIAKKNKWNTSRLANALLRAKRRTEFYEKLGAALKAGFYIVPAMDMDIFAIRTTAKKPAKKTITGEVTKWHDGPVPRDQETNNPPVGEGQYVSPAVITDEARFTEPSKEEPAKTKSMVTRWADQFADVDLPFELKKPVLLEATAIAMKKKIFDEVGYVRPQRSRDPMILGTVRFGNGWQAKRVAFLIAWFLDTREI